MASFEVEYPVAVHGMIHVYLYLILINKIYLREPKICERTLHVRAVKNAVYLTGTISYRLVICTTVLYYVDWCLIRIPHLICLCLTRAEFILKFFSI